jgi:hypothetical protein
MASTFGVPLLRSEPRQPLVEAESYLYVYKKATILDNLKVYGLPSPTINVHWKIKNLQHFSLHLQRIHSEFISLPYLLWLTTFNLSVEMWLRGLNIGVEDLGIKAQYLGAAMSISALLRITSCFAVRKAKIMKSNISTPNRKRKIEPEFIDDRKIEPEFIDDSSSPVTSTSICIHFT